MLMDKSSYYINGSTIESPNTYEEIPSKQEYEKLKKSKIEKNNRQKHKKNLQKRKTIIAVTAVFALGLLLMYNQSKVYSKQMKLTELKRNISELRLTHEDTQMKLYKLSNIETIRKNAQNKVGMVSMKKTKNVYVNFSKNYFKPRTSEAKMSKTKELLIKLKNLLF
ncbi:hypothetical protein [Clostridium oryzae]|uniref:Cell division protein FtsL n=1 Tax=Clostridium oryzae TaxID=1450648 RepID=A0A1V4ITA5_9CLOT|nr:hypothetical protein [Clostridium oryzae]OPJ63242.1 cell division protein FtsL [Clostridium oryzae]